MIEINLLPGGGRKKTTSARPSINIGAMLTGITSKLGNAYITGSAVAGVLVLLVVGVMWIKQGKDQSTSETRLKSALEDSTRYAGVVAERARLEAKRDTLLRQVNLIRSIDEDRYIWPHILDEVSRALSSYTWVTALGFAGTPAGSVNIVALPKPLAPAAAAVPRDTGLHTPVPAVPKAKPMPTAIPKDEIIFRVSGRTVDIQALTHFMRDLQASPFVSVVDIDPVTPSSDQGKEVYAFTLSVKYRRPDTTAVHRVPLVMTVR